MFGLGFTTSQIRIYIYTYIDMYHKFIYFVVLSLLHIRFTICVWYIWVIFNISHIYLWYKPVLFLLKHYVCLQWSSEVVLFSPTVKVESQKHNPPFKTTGKSQKTTIFPVKNMCSRSSLAVLCMFTSYRIPWYKHEKPPFWDGIVISFQPNKCLLIQSPWSKTSSILTCISPLWLVESNEISWCPVVY